MLDCVLLLYSSTIFFFPPITIKQKKKVVAKIIHIFVAVDFIFNSKIPQSFVSSKGVYLGIKESHYFNLIKDLDPKFQYLYT